MFGSGAKRVGIGSFVVWIAAPAGAAAATIRVPADYQTIEEAVEQASSGDVVLVSAGTYREEHVGIDKNLTLRGAGSGSTRIEGEASQVSVVYVQGGTVIVEGFTLAPAGDRGLTVYDGDVEIIDVEVVDHRSSQDGGAFRFVEGSATLTGVAVRGVTTNRSGGAVKVEAQADVTIRDSTFRDVGARRGGCVDADGPLHVVDSVFEACEAEEASGGDGGAIHAEGASLAIQGSTFVSSKADAGGAIYWDGADGAAELWVAGSSFRRGEVQAAGGAIAARSGARVSVSDSVFTANQSENAGAIGLDDIDAASVVRTWFCGNGAEDLGGAMVVRASGGTEQVTVTASVFVENNARYGGAIDLTTSSIALRNNTLLGNGASSGGGALYLHSAGVIAENNLIAFTSRGAAADGDQPPDQHDYNAWYDNADGDVAGAWPGLGANAVTAEPALQSYSADGDCSNDSLGPRLGSPLIDAGVPTLTDPDGSRSDIGAFGGPSTWPGLFADEDADGWINLYDCDDQDAAVNPDADEVCGEPGVDEDCNGLADGDDPGLTGGVVWYVDADGDSFGDALDPGTLGCDPPEASSLDATDCDDTDPTVYPGATEQWYDGVDQDCSGGDDFDRDGDAFPLDDDCDDEDASIYPGALDVLGDGVDQDCSGFDRTAWDGNGLECGCTSVGGFGAAWLAPLVLLALRRRRQ